MTWPFPPLHLPCVPPALGNTQPFPGSQKAGSYSPPRGLRSLFPLWGAFPLQLWARLAPSVPSLRGRHHLRKAHLERTPGMGTAGRLRHGPWPSATGSLRVPRLPRGRGRRGPGLGRGQRGSSRSGAERRASVPEPGARSPPVGAQDAAAVLPSFRPSVRRARPCGPSEAPLTGARPSPGDQLLQRHSRAPAVPTGMSAMDEEKGDVANGKCHFLEPCCFRRFMIYFVLTTTCGGAVSPTLHVKKRRRREIRQFAPR